MEAVKILSSVSDSLEIVGFKGKIENINETLELVNDIIYNCCDGCIIQLMDAKAIAGIIHIEHGILHGMNAFERGENIANNLGIEICLRTAGVRQISKALEIFGLKKGEMDLCAVLINCPDYFIDELSRYFTRDDSVLAPNDSILKDIYNISSKELNSMYVSTTKTNEISNISSILIDRTTVLISEI
ncbi:KEOPS complex subunit Cgi121 [Methanobrevibacter filiformis]|uniref:Kinase binding protein CGI-121 n=1 Tax=Methanobrevibacter filiformis TaxID=55758 RepID=A0A166CDY3_9EURY|nr:KEOPS complex subunit Cgi121 [Methanobrevibacter filiformis]KZX13497.1 kinase binding protein CGI-121 [Methanobrevibacter filiformis]